VCSSSAIPHPVWVEEKKFLQPMFIDFICHTQYVRLTDIGRVSGDGPVQREREKVIKFAYFHMNLCLELQPHSAKCEYGNNYELVVLWIKRKSLELRLMRHQKRRNLFTCDIQICRRQFIHSLSYVKLFWRERNSCLHHSSFPSWAVKIMNLRTVFRKTFWSEHLFVRSKLYCWWLWLL
jgi:hypothetical protein